MYSESKGNGKKGKIKVTYVNRERTDSQNHSDDHKRTRENTPQKQGNSYSKNTKNPSQNSRTRSEKSKPSKEQNTLGKNLNSAKQSWLEQHDNRYDESEAKTLKTMLRNKTPSNRTTPAQDNSNPTSSFSQPYTKHLEARSASDMDDKFLNDSEYPISQEQLREQRKNESKVYGENACLALFKHRPESIIKAWFLESVTPRFRETLRYLAANKKAYHVVDSHELQKISGTDHHAGVCLLIKKRQPIDIKTYLARKYSQDCIIALEGVANPHNIGAILRSAAHFGVNAILHAESSILDSGAAIRTAEGGAEHIEAIATKDFYLSLNALEKAGYTLVSTSSHKGKPLFSTQLPAKTVILIGQESDGLIDSSWQKGQLRVAINGTGKVESLNVSVATSIILAHWYQQQVI